MGVEREDFVGNPNRIDLTDDELDYDDEENPFETDLFEIVADDDEDDDTTGDANIDVSEPGLFDFSFVPPELFEDNSSDDDEDDDDDIDLDFDDYLSDDSDDDDELRGVMINGTFYQSGAQTSSEDESTTPQNAEKNAVVVSQDDRIETTTTTTAGNNKTVENLDAVSSSE